MEHQKRPSSHRVSFLLISLFVPLALLVVVLFAVGRAQAEPLAPHGTLTGKVINPDGSALESSITVDLGVLDEWGGCCVWIDSTSAAQADGTFGFDLSTLTQDAIPGDLYLLATPPPESGYFHNLLTSIYVNSTFDSVDAGTLTLTHASFAGMVYEPDGLTLATEGNLGVFDTTPGYWEHVAGGGYLTGTYAVGGVPDGEHLLVAFPPDDSIFWHSDPLTVTVNPGSQYISGTTQPISLTLRSPNVTGTVVLPDGSPAGWIVSENEEILGQAWVEAMEEVEQTRFDRPTDSGGNFGFFMGDNHYWIHARPEGTLNLTYTQSLPQYAVVSGTLYAAPLTLTYPSVRGVVLDPMDNPVDGCMNVWLEDEFGEWVTAKWHCSNAADPFQLGGVPAGDYWVRADGPDGSGFLPSDPVAFYVAPGSQYVSTATQTIDLWLNQAQVSVAVEDPNGEPITASVMLQSDLGEDLWEKSYPGQPATFGGLYDAHYRVIAYPMEPDIPTLANSFEHDVFLNSAGSVALTLTLQTPSVRGTVVLPDFSQLPPAFDGMDQPIHPAVVGVHNQDWSVDTWIMTNMLGEFALALPDGHFALRAYPEGTLGYTYTQSVRRPISVTNDVAPQDLGLIRLTYPRVQGVVVDPGGMRVSTEVYLWKDSENYGDMDETLWSPPDVDEAFRFGGLSAGYYYLQADPPADDTLGHGPSQVYPFLVDPGSPYWITSTQAITLHLTPANYVGEVLFPMDSHCPDCPVPDVHVRLRDDAWTFEEWATTDEMGKFVFSGLSPGSYYMDFFLGDDLAVDWDPPFPEPFTLFSATDHVTGTLYLLPAPHNKHVVGAVVYEDGSPITDTNGDGTGDVLVYAYHANSGRSAVTTSDPFDGSYEFHLGGGEWAINVEPTHPNVDWFIDPGWTQWAKFNLDETLPETQTVVFTATHAVYHDVVGRVEDPSGASPPPFTTWVDLCTDEGHCFGSPVEASGAFTVTVLPGTYRLWVWVDPVTGFLPPSANGSTVAVRGFTDLGILRLREEADRSARVTGRVIVSPTGQGLAGVAVGAWNDVGDWVSTETVTDGRYALNLLPGHVVGGPILSAAQQERYVILPPHHRDGYVGPGETETGQDFFLRRRDATIKGRVVPLGQTTPLSDVQAIVYAEQCDSTGCWTVDEMAVQGGTFELGVVGGITYSVGLWFPSGGYTLGPGVPAETYVWPGGEVAVALEVVAADAAIEGCLVEPPGSECLDLHASVFAISADENWVADSVWPGKEPPEFGLDVSGGTTWTLGYWVDPQSGYVISDTYEGQPLWIDDGQTVWGELPVVPLRETITGTVSAGGAPVPYAWVFAWGIEGTASAGRYFEAETDDDGAFVLPVLAGEYLVGVYPSPETGADYFPPEPIPWSSADPAQVDLVFSPRIGHTISGALSVTPTGALTGDVHIPVFARSEGGNTIEVTGTLVGGYQIVVPPHTRWRVWAAYEDPDSDLYYTSGEQVVTVEDTPVGDVDLTLTQSAFELPDTMCWTFDPAEFKRIQLPPRGDLPAPVVEIPAGTMPVTDRVEVCATPKVAIPSGQLLVGFAYELEARDGQGTLITQNFNRSVRLSFPFTPGLIPEGGEPSDLEAVFYSAARQEWVALEDLLIDLQDHWVTGRTDHFSRMGIRCGMGFGEPPDGGETYIYLPMVLRDAGG